MLEDNKKMLEEQAESQSKIDALEKDNNEKTDKISGLEKLYDELYKGVWSVSLLFILIDSFKRF